MSYADFVVEKFRNNSNPENIKPMADYLKGKFDLFGIKTPQRKEITKQIFNELEIPSEDEFVTIIKELWAQQQREVHYFTLDLINRMQKNLVGNYIDLWEYLIVTNSWWDSVDGIAANIIGFHFKKCPEDIELFTDKWMKSENMWLQRTCLLFQLKYKSETDTNLLEKFIEPLKDSKEFFIRKAIGWILREYSKTNADYVIKYVKNNQLSELSKKEALKWLNNRK